MLQHLIICLIVLGSRLSQAQESNALAARATTDTLGELESMGIQVLSNILSPSAAASTADSASASATSTSASVTSSSSLSATTQSSSFAQAAATSSAAPSSLSTVDKENTRHRNIAIIVGSVLGFVVLLLFLALIWFCCFSKRGWRGRKRGRKGVAEKDVDDDENETWGHSGPGATAYVTRIESWHEPRGSRNSSGGPPKGSQSRVSLVHRDVPERYNTVTSAPVPPPIPPPHRVSQYGLIQNESPFDDPRSSYTGRHERHSMDDAARESNKYPGYVPYRASQSANSLVADRAPTPLFGSGKTPGEQTIKRKSVGSGGPTAVNSPTNSNDPSPQSSGNGPWLPPRNRRRESVPGSPLAHEFEFGFGGQPRRLSRERMPGGWSNNSVAEAHQRF